MRTYEKTHPWITFQATDINRVPLNRWMLLGEAKSKAEHLAGAPLKPAIAQELYRVTLVKGALATTAIEGNSLTEEQVNGILNGTYKAPPTREYQEREVRNVLDALQGLHDQIVGGKAIDLTVGLICDFNRQILTGLPVDDGRSLRQAHSRIREALAVWLDRNPESLFIQAELPATLVAVADEVARARQEAESAGTKAQETTADAVRRLTDLGLSRRDAGDLLGLSHQRVQQLLEAS